jgi:hypothetical protein
MLPSKPPSIDERRNPPLIFCGDELNFPFPGLRCGCRRSTRRDSQRLLPFLWHARPPLFIYTRASLSAPPCPVRKQFPGPHSSSTLRAPTTIFADSRCTMRCFDCSPLTFSAELAADLRCEDGEPRVACPCRAAVDWILFEPNAVDSVGDAYRQPAGRFRQPGAKFQRKEGEKHWVVVVRTRVLCIPHLCCCRGLAVAASCLGRAAISIGFRKRASPPPPRPVQHRRSGILYALPLNTVPGQIRAAAGGGR